MNKVWTWVGYCAVLLGFFCTLERALEGDISASLAFGALTLYNVGFTMSKIKDKA